MRRTILFLPFWGCQAHHRLEVMEPAEVSIPTQVQTLAIVNREVSPLSKRSVEELSGALVDSPRYDIVDQGKAQDAYQAQTSTVGSPLNAKATAAICKATNATGIVSLERFRDGGGWDVTRDIRPVTETQTRTITHEDGTETTQEEEITKDVEFCVATYRGDLGSDWIVYGCGGARHDEYPLGMTANWWAEGKSVSDAKSLVGDVAELERELARDLGRRYLRHISPYNRVLHRRYFRGFNKHLRAGHRSMKIGQIEAARKHWKVASEHHRAKTQAKGWLNLAVVQEHRSNLDRALELSNKAGQVLTQYWVSDYSDQLKSRKEQMERLEAQMAAPAPKSPPPPPVEKPAVKPDTAPDGAPAVKPESAGDE